MVQARSASPSLGIASFAAGVLALVAILVEPTIAFALALVGLFLGLLARRDASSRGLALVPLVLNAAVLVFFTGVAANLFP
jgi:hypothetical protein